MIGSEGAVNGEVVTSVGQRTPGGSNSEGQAVSAVIVGKTTRRDDNANLAGIAPCLSNGADAFSSGAVVVGDQRAISGEVVTLASDRTEAGTSLVG